MSHHMPVPAALMGVTGLFAVLAVIADAAPATRPAVTMLAWGLDIAGLLNILPRGLYGQIGQAQQAEATASGAGIPATAPANNVPVPGFNRVQSFGPSA